MTCFGLLWLSSIGDGIIASFALEVVQNGAGLERNTKHSVVRIRAPINEESLPLNRDVSIH